MIAQPTTLTVGTMAPDRLDALIDHVINIDRDQDDQRRVTTDLINQNLDPADFNVDGIVAHMRGLAGGRPLDSVSDQDWSDALAWHQRSLWPTASSQGVAEVNR